MGSPEGAPEDRPVELEQAVEQFETAVFLDIGAIQAPDSPAGLEDKPQGE